MWHISNSSAAALVNMEHHIDFAFGQLEFVEHADRWNIFSVFH
jgi:hypothetical protein